MTKKTETKRARRSYRKPQLEQVRLVAEEAVLTNCKAVSGGSPNKATGQCNVGVLCLSLGS